MNMLPGFMKKAISYSAAAVMSTQLSAQQPVYASKAYSIYADKVEQDAFVARALSATQLQSNYESPANAFQSANLNFKFAINGKDNEMLPGTDHHFTVRATNGAATTPLIVFGKQLNEPPAEGVYLEPQTKLTIRLDMREVQKQFAEQGFFTTAKGVKIYKEDFKAVYVAGSAAPLTWDFDNLKNRAELELKDADGDGIFETTVVLNSKSDLKKIEPEWKLTKDISAFPQYISPHQLGNAIYNMSLEEMERAVEKDSTLRTGKEWAGVWTRDVSYSIILSMAYMQPKVARNSLLRKVNSRKRIIQDTGTGGAWPASTDRMIWAVAAWQIYLATGDKGWLKQAYEIIANSLQDDYETAYDAASGLVRGESSFLDWREQTYPKWMQPADIFESNCLGTNAAHFQANMVMSKMAKQLNKATESTGYAKTAEKIKAGINKYLWMADKGYYGQYLYGRNFKLLSPRSEALGEALCVLFDIAGADKQQKVIANTPIVDYGITCLYPQIPGLPPYHNNAIWPFVQTYWLWAAAKAGNEASVMESIAAIYRPAALFLTNKENFVADNGDFSGTVINSSNMLWSLSGNISIVHKVLFGINFTENGLLFKPFVPKALQGKRSLTNFKYRGAVYDIDMEGYGNTIKLFQLDGKTVAAASVAANSKGKHRIKIILGNSIAGAGKVNKVENRFTLPTPLTNYADGKMEWKPIDGAKHYQVLKNGMAFKQTTAASIVVPADGYAEYQVMAIDADNHSSFASEPLVIAPEILVSTYEAETFASQTSLTYKGFTGKGFAELSRTENKIIRIPIKISEDGLYAVDVRYSNGNGPINTENKCAIRSLYADEVLKGAIVMPQRGTNEWSDWGYSNSIQMKLVKGDHVLVIKFEDWNENMNGEVNQAMVDHVRVTRIVGSAK